MLDMPYMHNAMHAEAQCPYKDIMCKDCCSKNFLNMTSWQGDDVRLSKHTSRIVHNYIAHAGLLIIINMQAAFFMAS